MKLTKVLLTLLSGAMILFAHEGMFLPDDIPYKAAKKAGLKLKPHQIFSVDKPSVSDAIVQIGGGSGSFVSSQGLVITNHHVAFRGVQQISTPDNNILENGYYAKTLDEELSIPGYRAIITKSNEDITPRILTNDINDQLSPTERIKKIEANIKIVVEEAEKEAFIKAQVKSMYNGLSYYLIKRVEYEDIRLVNIPHRAVGEFGGDIDNWMWPRHTGDYTFFRIYADSDGNPAKYDESNTPYAPKHFLPFSSKGVKEGDFTMILGYPGSTERYLTANYAAYTANTLYPQRITIFSDVLAIIEELSAKDPAVRLKLISMNKAFNNVLKNNQGMLEGFKNLHLIDVKYAMEDELKKNAKNGEFTAILDEIMQVEEVKKTTYMRNFIQGWLTRLPTLARIANASYRWTVEQEKPDMERDMGYMNRDRQNHLRKIKPGMLNYTEAYDKALLNYLLNKATELPENMSLDIIGHIKTQYPGKSMSDAISTYIDNIYEGTAFTDLELQKKSFDMSNKELLALNDPMIEFVKILEGQSKGFRDVNDDIKGKLTLLMPKYFEAMAAASTGDIYPDANSTMRFTYGVVKGYSPKDTVHYDYITSVEGMLAKQTGENPFDLPADFLEIASKSSPAYTDNYLNDIPVNFLHTTDITGGNSGSAVMNARGHFIGIAFDGNWEAMTSDWLFDEALTRTISVDARFILFVLDKVTNGQRILNEMDVR